LRDARDAQIILEAVRRNYLPLIKRRLVAAERAQLAPGNVYVWEEAEDDGGQGGEGGLLLRWTDGRRWSQSRMRGDFLFYEEKVETTQDERDAKAARRAKRAADPTAVIPPPTRRKDRPSKPHGLTKQTYSAIVYPPGATHGKKWHVVAYFLVKDYAKLPVIEHYENLRQLQIPQGAIMTTKTIPFRPERNSEYSDDDADSETQSTRFSSHYPISDRRAVELPSITSLHPPRRPGLFRSTSDGLAAPGSVMPTPDAHRYAPLTPEDRRALDSFRVVL
ncbi:Gti1/Pac2 family-domain-containing protein, partial [Mucidula mucida]